jgi:conjugal transfer ATP-binding protein TraC
MNLSKIGSKISEFFGGLLEPKEKDLSAFGEVYHLSDFLPYKWRDEESEVFISNDQVGIIFETAPLVGNSESMQRELSAIFTQILPEESSVQIALYADKNVGDVLNFYADSRAKASETLQKLAEKRAKFLSGLAIKSNLFPYVLRDFKCFLSVSLDMNSDPEEAIRKIVEIKKQICATLNVAGVGFRSVNPSGLLRFLDNIFNSDFSSTEPSAKKWNKFDPINIQVLANDTDVVVEDDLLKLRNGEVEIKTFSASGYPHEWTLNQMSELIGDAFRDSRQFPFPFLMHYGVHIPKQSGKIAQIALKANMVEKQLFSPIGKYIPDIEREHAELEFAQQNLAKGERLVQTQFSIVLFSPKGESSAAEQTLKTMFSSMLFKVESNAGMQLHSLLTTLPLSWNRSGVKVVEEFKKLRTTISTESSNLAPMQAEWKGTETPAMIFGGRKGQITTFCPFDNKAGNYNVTVVGRSGAGKSVFMHGLDARTRRAGFRFGRGQIV